MVTTNDPAGTAINFRHALNRHTGHHCRLITTEIRYNFLFEKDLHVPWLKEFGELEQVLREADLFHFHMGADEDLSLGPFRVRDFLRGKSVVHHHHGEPPFRENPRRFAEKEIKLGRRAIVSTPDLLRGYPEATWVPNPVPLDHEDYLPKAEYNGRSELILGHSPTRRELKNTTEFVDVVRRLQESDCRIRSRIIENTEHRQCLKLKRDCDLFFDHMQGYYGVSSLEALAMGVPTIAGIDDWNRRCIGRFTGQEDIPWVVAQTPEELEKELRSLLSSTALRSRVGRGGRKWMEKYWTGRRISEELCRIYEVA
jgi:glycosyltransferase involved in cell wall biosynthesis